jgi:hypothetical protein
VNLQALKKHASKTAIEDILSGFVAKLQEYKPSLGKYSDWAQLSEIVETFLSDSADAGTSLSSL